MKDTTKRIPQETITDNRIGQTTTHTTTTHNKIGWTTTHTIPTCNKNYLTPEKKTTFIYNKNLPKNDNTKIFILKIQTKINIF